MYLDFKNFDNEFYFLCNLQDYNFPDDYLYFFSKKYNVMPIASENVYSLCYGIDKKDNTTKIFIGETDDFDECHEIVADNFYDLMNSNKSLIKIYNFMKKI